MGIAARIETSPGRLSVRTATLQDLILAAYGIEDYQLTAGPAWVKSERFAVEAKSAEPAGREQLILMLRPLLTDRFPPVIDRTGLTGNFDLDLDMDKILTPAVEAAGGNPSNEAIFDQTANALNYQIGLKLVSTKAPIEVFIIDRAERPTEN